MAPLKLFTLAVLLIGSSYISQAQPSVQPQEPVAESDTAQSSAQPIPTLKISSRLVLVDAVVTDKKGNPVTNLKAEDFNIFENGQPQAIREFGVHSSQQTQEQATSTPPPQPLRPGLFTNITDFHPEYGPLTIILLDLLNTQVLDQPGMRKGVVKYLQKIGPRNNIVIYSMGTTLQLVHGLNADPHIFQEALKLIAADPSLKHQPKQGTGATDESSRIRALASDLLGVGEGYNKERQILRTQGYKDVSGFAFDRARFTMEALRRIALSMAGYPGRKNLIWISAGFPMYTSSISLKSGKTYDYLPKIAETINLLANTDVSVYPVDARGLVIALDSTPNNFHTEFDLQTLRIDTYHAGMDALADYTGGRAYYNRNNIDTGIEVCAQDGSNYYTLGYYPTNKDWNGAFRQIELKLAAKGLEVHYRRGYYAEKAGNLTAAQKRDGKEEFENSLALDAPTATLLPVVSHVDAPGPGHKEVLVKIGVDPHSIFFEQQANDRQNCEVRFATIVLDASGQPITSRADILNTQLTPQTFTHVMSSSLVVQQKFDLPAGKYLLRIGVQDIKSNMIGTVLANVEVPVAN